MSASITQSVVRKQLCAMGCELFEIGVLRSDGRMLLRSGWSARADRRRSRWLRRENARGAQIFVRPHGAHALSLVDDLSAEAITRMTDDGFQPAARRRDFARQLSGVAESRTNTLDRTFSTQAAKELARRFGGDPSSADWRHFGRLAGFTNQKPKRRLRSGLPPFVRLRRMRGADLRRGARISRGSEIARGEGQRRTRCVDGITFDFDRRLGTTPHRVS